MKPRVRRTKKDFTEFKKWCRYYQKEFGVTGYHLYFEFNQCVPNSFAGINADQRGRTANVFLAPDAPDHQGEEVPTVQDLAKHEMIHLMLSNYDDLARDRFGSAGELDIEHEKVVVKLERLLK